MDLGQEFKSILITYGHDIFLQRRKADVASGPYMEIDGGRYETTAEKWTVYRWFPSLRRGSRMAKMQPEGFVYDYEAIFYFQPEAEPKEGDLISEYTPHERVGRAAYRVEHAVPYYFSNALIYFAALCSKVEPS